MLQNTKTRTHHFPSQYLPLFYYLKSQLCVAELFCSYSNLILVDNFNKNQTEQWTVSFQAEKSGYYLLKS